MVGLLLFMAGLSNVCCGLIMKLPVDSEALWVEQKHHNYNYHFSGVRSDYTLLSFISFVVLFLSQLLILIYTYPAIGLTGMSFLR